MILSQIITIAGDGYDIDYSYYNGGAINTIKNAEVPGGSRETVTYTYDGLGQPFDLIGSQTYVDDAAWTAGRCGWCARSEPRLVRGRGRRGSRLPSRVCRGGFELWQ